MSSTRRSTDGEFHQERYCSAPEFEGDAINGLPAAKRIALVKDKSAREVLWFLQWRSLAPGGLQAVCDELVTSFPERIGTPTLRKLSGSKRDFLNKSELQKIRDEFGLGNVEDWSDYWLIEGQSTRQRRDEIPVEERKLEFYRAQVREQLDELPTLLKQFCLDPKSDIARGVWFFDDLLGALVELRKRTAGAARSRLAETAIALKIFETLDFWLARRRMVLIEGVAGIGRTASARAWSDSQCGLVRLIEVPSSRDDRSFFAAIARELGVARGTSMKAQEIKVRIEEMLATSELLLAFDESQYLWGGYERPRKTPDRLLWIKTVFDGGSPICLVAHTDFSKWQAHYVKRTLWTDEQFERRLNRRVVLQPEHSEEDMLKIARAHLPNGDRRCWKLLAGYALGTEKKQASGIVEALESARYRAERAGRDQVTFGDIEAALRSDHGFLPFEPALQPARTVIAKPLKPARKERATTPVLPPETNRFGRLAVAIPT
jgi:hypothetical protein